MWRRYKSSKATLELARANLKRGEELAPSGGISKEELDVRRQTVKVDEAAVDQALQAVYATRVSLGLPAQPAPGHDLTEVPPDLDQNFSGVRQALGNLLQSAAQFGYCPGLVERDPEAGPRGVLQAGPRGRPRPHLVKASSRTRRPSSRPRPSSSRPAATWTRPS